MRLTKEQKWLWTIRWLRRNFPPTLPTYVKSAQMEDCGDTIFSEDAEDFRIRVRSNHSLNLKVDTLLHEWAHVLTWFGAEFETEEHSAEWGVMYAKLYRTFIEWDFGRAEKKRANNGPLPGQREFDF